MQTLAETKEYFTREVERCKAYLQFLEDHYDTLTALDIRPSFFMDTVDFNNLTRPEVVKVIKAFPGKWAKTPSYHGDGITYTLNRTVSNLSMRIYNGEPPASCKIVETVEYQVIPERVERIVHRKVVCPETTAS
jgi:hypothetical protein